MITTKSQKIIEIITEEEGIIEVKIIIEEEVGEEVEVIREEEDKKIGIMITKKKKIDKILI